MTLSDPRRIVTGHTPHGKSIIVSDIKIKPELTAVKCDFAVLYETNKFPSSNYDDDSSDKNGFIDPIKTRTKDLANNKGIVLRVVDFPPHTETIYHRTESLDFGILFSGEITCHLDDGVRIDMKAGDTCVQRGTIHGWTNYSDEVARVYFILTAAEPLTIGGKPLETTGFDRKDVESGGGSH